MNDEWEGKKVNTTDILERNVKDLQQQLTQANKRIFELGERTSKLMKEREYNLRLIKDASNAISDIKKAIKVEEDALHAKVQKQIDDWPDVLDSKPKKNIGDKSTSLSGQWQDSGEWTKFENDVNRMEDEGGMDYSGAFESDVKEEE